MSSLISYLKVIVKNNKTHQPISGANVHWEIIPDSVRNKSAFCKKHKDSEEGLQVDVTNQGGFSLLMGKLGHDSKLWFYIHQITCLGFKEIMIENKLSVKSGTEKEFTVYLYPDNEWVIGIIYDNIIEAPESPISHWQIPNYYYY